MAKHSHKLIVRYSFTHGGQSSNITKLCKSEADAKQKEDDVYNELINLGHSIISSEIIETKK